MEIEEQKIDGILCIKISGRIDAYTSERLEEEINSIINSGKLYFLVNFENVKYISSSGLRVLLGAYKTLSKHGGKIRLSQIPDEVLRVFTMAGFDKIFEIYPEDREALRGFKNTPQSGAKEAA